MDIDDDHHDSGTGVEALVGSLREQGTPVDSVGEFTLDREQARQKMSEFGLSEPHSYVLELVQAAVLKCATHIEVMVDTDDVELQCNGRHFSEADFADLYSAVFTRTRGDADHQARRELALGLAASQALKPRWITVCSFERSSGAELDIRPGGQEHFESITQRPAGLGPSMHTKIHLRFPKTRLWARPEAQIVRERCRWAQTSILCNGEFVTGPALPEAFAVSVVERPHLRVEAGYVFPGDPAEVHLVLNGVHIATHPLENLPQGLVAIAQTDRLRKDASARNVVQDSLYKEVLQVVGEAVAKGRQAHDIPQLLQTENQKWIARSLDKVVRPWPKYMALCYGVLGLGFLSFLTGLGLVLGTKAEWPLFLALFMPVGFWIHRLGSDRVIEGAVTDFDRQFPKPTHPRERKIAMELLEKDSTGGSEGEVRKNLLAALTE